MEEFYVRGVLVVSVISTEVCAKAKRYGHSVTIDMLPDNVLLEIFGFCLCDPTRFPLERTKKWQRLVHVCRRWRQIIFSSPRHLDLCLSCSKGLPVRVRDNLKFWPVTMPVAIDYPPIPLAFLLSMKRILLLHSSTLVVCTVSRFMHRTHS